MKNNIWTVMVFITIFVICLLFQGRLTTERVLDWREYEEKENAVTVGELVDGTEIEQIIPVQDKNISAVGISYATYGGRENSGEIVIEIWGEDEEKLGEDVLDVSEIADNEIGFISLDKPAYGKAIKLRLKAVGSEEGKAVTLWAASNTEMEEEGGELTINGNNVKEQLETVLYYRTIVWSNFLLAGLVSFLGTVFLKKC